MLPLILGMAALGAVQAEQQRKAQARAQEQNAQMAAAQTKYSPWTGMGPGQVQAQAPNGGALQGAMAGGLSGAMFGQQFADKPPTVYDEKVAPINPLATQTDNQYGSSPWLQMQLQNKKPAMYG